MVICRAERMMMGLTGPVNVASNEAEFKQITDKMKGV